MVRRVKAGIGPAGFGSAGEVWRGTARLGQAGKAGCGESWLGDAW